MEPLPPPSIALVGSTESKRADKKGNFRFAASRANCIFNHVRVSPVRRSPLLSQRLWTIARAFSCGFRFRWSSWMLPAVPSTLYAVSPVLLAVLQAVLGCSPCSSGTHGMYFSTYMPCHLDMPPCGRLSGLAPSSDLAGSSEEGPLKRAFSEPRAQAEPSARDRAQPAGAGRRRGAGRRGRFRLWFDMV